MSGEVTRLADELNVNGHALTSFARIGVGYFDELAAGVARAVETAAEFRRATDSGRHGMLMIRDDATVAKGKILMTPVFKALEALFGEEANSGEKFPVSGINHYDVGDTLNPHHDYDFEGTVLIATVCGDREFHVYEPEDEDDVFLRVQRTYSLHAGSIMLLHGAKNLGHSATCIRGPSVSVVADAPSAIST